MDTMRLNNLDLNQLVTLELLLQERSASKVATRLHVSQPAISAVLRRLRAFFDDQLFVQSGREMIPTSFAMSLVGPLHEMLLRAASVSQMRPDNDVHTSKRTVRVAVSDFIATVLLAPILRRALDEAPQLRFELVSVFDSRQHYHEDLERGDVDVLIVPQLYASNSHRQQFLLEEEYVCIACCDHNAVRSGISLHQFLSAGHVGVTNRTVAGRPYDELHLERLGISRRIEVAVPSLSWIPPMLVGTQRLSVIHYNLALDLAKRWPIRVLPCPVPIPPLREIMQWHSYQDANPAICWLKKQLIAESQRVNRLHKTARKKELGVAELTKPRALLGSPSA